VKHLRILLPLLILALILSGCGKQSPEPYTYTFSRDNQVITLTVNPETRTILDGTDVYDYVAEKHGSITSYVITYPNGATYHWTATEHGGAGGWSDDYDETAYISGNILVFAIEEGMPREKQGNPALGLLIVLLGGIHALFPKIPIYIKYGWRFENAQPSEAYLLVTRIGGILAVIAGLVWCFI
jgi:hypothetical protein